MSMLVSHSMRFCTDNFGETVTNTTSGSEDVNEYGGGGDSADESVTETGTETTTGEKVSSKENQERAAFVKTGFLKGTKVWNCRGVSAVTGFDITAANLDVAGVDCRVVFVLNNKLDESHPNKAYTLTPSSENPLTAKLVPFDYDIGTDTKRQNMILEHGNTIAEIRNFTSIPEFIGKVVSPWYALKAPSDSLAMPIIRLDLKTYVSMDATSKTFESDVYTLAEGGAAPIISEISADVETVDGGEVDVSVKLFDENDSDGSSWMSLDAAKNQKAYSVQFKFDYSVQTARAEDMVKVNSIAIRYSYGETLVNSDSAEIYTVVTNYEVPLQMCYCIVRHDQLVGSSIKAYVNFMHKPKHRELLYLGQISNNADGKAELILGESNVPDANIDPATIKIYAGNGTASGTDYEINGYAFSSENSTITISGELNTRPIYASYDYNVDVEEWREMTLDITEPYTGDATYSTRFTYALPDDEARPSDEDSAKVISNVKIEMIRGKGTVKRANLGVTTTGKRQLFALEHVPKVNTIKFTSADGKTTYGTDKINWTYNDETNILSLVGKEKNLPLYISYGWTGESVVIHSIACGWSVA